ncbi:MMPL family transporter [Pimelobacter simplex]|nr:MMPL family transporter [Pimelobacter simplex]MCG8154242.1 MMPL family transporter [Pimelobacter simplex]GEB11688.1 putative membrane protein ActII-3 [Pimelobacter simplex]SFN00473.1 putative drug exporter of the RND superfamily [Pimelobacter simplex]
MHRQIAGKLTGPVTKWVVLVVVLLLTGGLGFLGSKLADVKDNQASSWLPGSAESSRVADELSTDLDPNDIPTLVVYHREGGLTPADLDAMDAQAAKIAQVEGVTATGVLTPHGAEALAAAGKPAPRLISEDGEVAYSFFNFNFGDGGWAKVPASAKDVRKIAKIDGVTTYVGGFGGQASDFAESFEGSHVQLLMITFGVVILILLLTYRSPILWILPILCAALAYMMSRGVVYLLAKYVDLTVNDQSEYILSILCIGAGTDYALLLVARYREELRRHEDRHEAMAFALHRATPALIASAATVAVGLLCLVFADLNSTASLGPVLAVGVVVTLLTMITLLPALLVIVGRWIFWPKRPSFGSDEPTAHGLWARVGARIAPRPRAVWVVTTGVLLIACLGLFRLDATGLTTEESVTGEIDSVTAQKLMAEHGLADSSVTLQVVADADRIDAVRTAVGTVDGLGAPTPVRPLADGRAWFESAVSVDIASPTAFRLVEDARAAVREADGAHALVGGGPAVYLDSKIAADHDNRLIIPIVLVVVFLILVLLLRALLAPLLLMATVVLSFGAALGISALLFEYVLGFAGSDPGFPLFAFVFLVALGIDYNIFLMTRVREETVTHGTRKGSLIALSSTGGVITSAGLVLAATFLALGTLPLVFLAELGVAVALGVLLDTMIVRSVLVTALNLDLGGRIWWPSKLDRGTPSAPEPPAPATEKVPALD